LNKAASVLASEAKRIYSSCNCKGFLPACGAAALPAKAKQILDRQYFNPFLDSPQNGQIM